MTKGIIFFIQSPNKSLYGDISGWTNSLDKLGVDFYIAIDEEKIEPNWTETKNLDGYRVNNFQEALDKLEEIHSECKTVWLNENNSTELKDFIHPINACYILGPDTGIINPTCDHNVKLYAPSLWAKECAVTVLYDRYSKE